MAHILIVDDDPAGRELLRILLQHAGHQSEEAVDGAQALQLAQQTQPDLIVADVLMPTMDGFEFVRRLREFAGFADTPVVFYSASYLEREARHLANRCGVSEILTKPCEPQQLLDSINRALGSPVPAVQVPPLEDFHREHASLLTTKLSQTPSDALDRLKALIDLGLQHASEHDPRRLLSGFCSAARKIIGAQYAVVGVVVERSISYRHSSGIAAETGEPLASTILPATPERLARQRLDGLSGKPRDVGLPDLHPPVYSLLAEPIIALGQTQACLYLSNKVGSGGFSDDDAALARILATQLGRIYANAQLYSQVQQQMKRLELEVAERRRAQEEVQQLNVELEQRIALRTSALKEANEELEAFAHTVSHDLRAPLRAINGFAALLTDQFSNVLPAEGQRLLGIIRKNGLAMTQLVEDLLSFSKYSRQVPTSAPVDMNALVAGVIEDFRTQTADGQAHFDVAPLPPTTGDATLLRQVWINLLSNALKYRREDQTLQVSIGAEVVEDGIEYFVRDNGIGFSMEEASTLFTPFHRLHGQGKYEGTGVGLSLCKRIVQRHGGSIRAEGQPDAGAVFRFTLPRSGA